MKKMILLVPIVALSLAAHAKIWRVNNMPGVTADATTAQAAHNLASNGDTIHLEPSSTDYGNVSCTKRLTWLSLGAFLAQNPGNQASSTFGIIGHMYFSSGSAGSIAMVISNGYAYFYTNDITITRSFFLEITNQVNNNTGIVITRNFINGSISLGTAANAIVTNNMVGSIINNESTGSIVVSNNIFGGNSTSGGNLYNSVFQNNILRNGNNMNFTNSVASYNITSSSGGLPAGNNNVFSVAMANVFENDGTFSQGRVDKDYRLKAGSPAIGAGSGGVDMGAFGGSSPYVLALQPNIPAITAMSTPASNNSSTIQVTFSAKSNN